jgi:copper oxidase (laccase) domain-containing protein
MTHIIATLILLGILALLAAAGIYFARGQKTRNQGYRTWSNVLGPQFRGSAFDVGEKLNEDISAGKRLSHPAQRHQHHHKKNKESQ